MIKFRNDDEARIWLQARNLRGATADTADSVLLDYRARQAGPEDLDAQLRPIALVTPIKAIELYRERTSCSLKEAKDYVMALRGEP